MIRLTSATLGTSNAAGSPRKVILGGQRAPVPLAEAMDCFLLSSALRVPMSRTSFDTVTGPNMLR